MSMLDNMEMVAFVEQKPRISKLYRDHKPTTKYRDGDFPGMTDCDVFIIPGDYPEINELVDDINNITGLSCRAELLESDDPEDQDPISIIYAYIMTEE